MGWPATPPFPGWGTTRCSRWVPCWTGSPPASPGSTPPTSRSPSHRPCVTAPDERVPLMRSLTDGDGNVLDPVPALGRVRDQDPRLAVLIEPMLGVTLSPTRISASEKVNVIPARAELQVDCR